MRDSQRRRCAASCALALSAALLAAFRPLASPLEAQGLSDDAPRREDVETLDGIVAAFYDVVSTEPGGEADWSRDSTLYVADVRFTILEPRPNGGATARRVSHGTYAAESNGFLSAGFLEREIHREVHRFGPMVQLFSTYEWSRGGGSGRGGRGVNSMQLHYDGQRWWIVGVMWMGESERHPIPARFLPPDGRHPDDAPERLDGNAGSGSVAMRSLSELLESDPERGH
jgi:hypothetical protein